MRIAVIGTGYVGLVTGAGLADFGNDVTCVDVDEKKIASLQVGKMPVYEPGLETIVARNAGERRLRFSTDIEQAIRDARAIFIAVGTPPKEDGSADLRHVEAVARTIAANVNGPKLVITKSTVPIGTGRIIERILAESEPEHECHVASNPEFLREGSALEDFMRPDRVVVGASAAEAFELVHEIYTPLHSLEVPFVDTTIETAELIKYASNAFLATKITFINEVASLCERVNADVQDVARGMGLDSQIGSKFLQAGPGYGGSCFPKDTSALIDISRRHGYFFDIVESVVRANERLKGQMVAKVDAAVGGARLKTIAVLGLAFKPETDDIRDSPALALIEGLQRRGAVVRVYDPAAMRNAKPLLRRAIFCHDAYDAAEGADAIVIATEWNEFRSLDLARLATLLREPVLIDLRNVYAPEVVARAGFRYVSIGRHSLPPAVVEFARTTSLRDTEVSTNEPVNDSVVM